MRFRNSRLLIRLVLSFLAAGALLTMLLMVVVSGSISRQITQQANLSAREMLLHAYNTTYYALTDIYGDFYSLWSKDPAVGGALAAASMTEEQVKAVDKILEASAFRDTLVHSVYLINDPAHLVLSSLAAPSTPAAFGDPGALALIQEFEANYSSMKNEVFFPRIATITVDGIQETHTYISMIFTTMNDDHHLSGSVMVNIEQPRLSALVNVTPEGGQMMIVSQSGKIVSDLSGDTFARDFPDASLYQGILASAANEGGMTVDLLGVKSIISYQKADRLGFVFLSITPYARLMAPVIQANRTIALLFGGAILLSLLATYVATRKIYRPLHLLIRTLKRNPSVNTSADQDEVTYLDAAYGNLIAQDRQAHLSRLIQGHFASQTLEILEFSRAKFLCLAIMADQPRIVSAGWLEQLVQTVRRILRIPAAVTSGDCVSLVYNADAFDETEMDWIIAQIDTLQTEVKSVFHTTISVGIGTVAAEAGEIRLSHRNAVTAVQHALTLGSGQLVPYAEIESHRQSASLNRSAIAAAIKEIIEANYQRPGFALDEIADSIGLSAGYVRQIFKLERGVPINEFIITYRIGKACEILANTDLTAKEISERVGYMDSHYFYTLFKRRIGMTTDEYRRSQITNTENQTCGISVKSRF